MADLFDDPVTPPEKFALEIEWGRGFGNVFDDGGGDLIRLHLEIPEVIAEIQDAARLHGP